jgi:phytanoyl-CoA hydroxylase
MDALVPLEVAAGTLIAFHGGLPHWSAPNLSDRPRLAYTLHVIDGTADYRSDNWLQRGPDLPLRGFG